MSLRVMNTQETKSVGQIESRELSSRSGDPPGVAPKSPKRIFSFLQLFFLSLTFLAGWEAPIGNLFPSFYNGGPEVLFWGTIVVWVGAMAQAASLAEMASMLPIAGAQYHWTAALAPIKSRKFITWMQGWLTWLAWICLMASVLSIIAYTIQGAVSLNNTAVQFEPWHSFLMMMATLALLYAINMWLFWLVPWFELISGTLHILLFFVYIGVFLGLTKTKRTTDFVFFGRVDSTKTSGWSVGTVSWHLGLLTAQSVFCGFDAAVHLSEEVRGAHLVVPRAIFWSVASCGVFALPMIVVILYCSGDVLNASKTSPAPFLAIALQATGSVPAATALGVGILYFAFTASIANFLSSSRLTWAWARDGGFGPASSYFAKVNDRGIPARATTLTTAATVVLSIPAIKSTVAFQALTSLSTLALYLSYAVAISCMLLNRFSIGSTRAPRGEWNMGRFGAWVNGYAIVHSLYMSFWLPWPSTLPTTAENMNWAGPIVGFVLLLAGGAYPFIKDKWPGVNQKVVDRVVRES